jgi:tetratricopeptide (TPR) repeat protein
VIHLALVAALLAAGAPGPATGGYGHVEFTNSGAAAAQADFLAGLAMLHDFEYESGAAAFRRAEAGDPGFAMAFWGEAMTYNHPIWMQQDLDGARAALAKLAPTAAERRARAGTDREKEYLDAIEILYGDGSKVDRDLRYEAAMERLHRHYPDDVDAAAFYGLSILGTAHAGRDVAIYMRAAGVLEQAWMDHREHPGLLHYLIHCYDDPAHAPLGLRAARIYARVAPDAAHAQHMTSHIFLALGMWTESVDANLAAIAAADRTRAAQGKDPLRCGHYPSWLGYSYLQLGDTARARQTLDGCRDAVTSHADADHPGEALDPDESLSGSLESMRLRYLIDTGDWAGDVAAWPLPATAGPGGRLDFAFAQALAAIARGRAAEAREGLDRLAAAGREASDIEVRRAEPDPSYRRRPEIFLLEARALLAESEGDLAAAEKGLREAVGVEETLPIAFGPPTIDKPTHELLGEFLLRHGRVAEARGEFEKALARTPGRRLAVQGLAAAAPGTGGS